jgi:predicted 3-demethylubiquinone-9 3-methyltransferase (glyoxalase superfamily)
MAAQNTGRFCEWQVGILFVEGESVAEIARLAMAQSAGGAVLMPLDDYGLSRQFTWVSDRLGASWQHNLA